MIPNRNTFMGLSLIFVVLGGPLLIANAWSWHHSPRETAVVLRLEASTNDEGNTLWRPVVKLVSPAGAREGISTVAYQHPGCKVGDEVSVIVTQQSPLEVKIAHFDALFSFPLILLLIGGGTLLTAAMSHFVRPKS